MSQGIRSTEASQRLQPTDTQPLIAQQGGTAKKSFSIMGMVQSALRYIPSAISGPVGGLAAAKFTASSLLKGTGIGAACSLFLTGADLLGIKGPTNLINNTFKKLYRLPAQLAYRLETADSLNAVTLLAPATLTKAQDALPPSLKNLLEKLPEGGRKKLYTAMLYGAHVTIEGNHNLKLSTWDGIRRSSSHYPGAGQQYGKDLTKADNGFDGHLLFGPTSTPDKVFVQFEGHGTGGVKNFIGHMTDYFAHLSMKPAEGWFSQNEVVQVGPLGCIGFSEKNGSEIKIIVDKDGTPTIQP